MTWLEVLAAVGIFGCIILPIAAFVAGSVWMVREARRGGEWFDEIREGKR